MDTNTINLGTREALLIATQLLPLLEAGVPVVGKEGEKINLALGAATVFVPMVTGLINQLAVQEMITTEEQAGLLARWNKLLDFSGPEWTPAYPVSLPPGEIESPS